MELTSYDSSCKVTVVIPNYNGIKYLDDCLKALYSCGDECKFHTIVIDNGSTDGSEKFLEKWPEVEGIMLSENTGFCHAVNLGIEKSTTDFVILLNNDTKVLPGFVSKLYEAISRDDKIFSVSAAMLMWDKPELLDDAGDRLNVLGWAYARGKGKPKADYNEATEVLAACGGAAIYRKSILETIGCFDENHFAYLEDIDLGYRARIYGYKNMYEPKACVLHFGSASSGSRYNPWKTKMAAANNIYVIYKNMPFLQLLLNLPFLLLGYIIKYIFFVRKGMGKEYLEGLKAGIKKSFSKQGKDKKIRFKFSNFGNYIIIQLHLYIDTIRFIKTK